jgi:hypothetical protein
MRGNVYFYYAVMGSYRFYTRFKVSTFYIKLKNFLSFISVRLFLLLHIPVRWLCQTLYQAFLLNVFSRERETYLHLYTVTPTLLEIRIWPALFFFRSSFVNLRNH